MTSNTFKNMIESAKALQDITVANTKQQLLKEISLKKLVTDKLNEEVDMKEEESLDSMLQELESGEGSDEMSEGKGMEECDIKEGREGEMKNPGTKFKAVGGKSLEAMGEAKKTKGEDKNDDDIFGDLDLGDDKGKEPKLGGDLGKEPKGLGKMGTEPKGLGKEPKGGSSAEVVPGVPKDEPVSELTAQDLLDIIKKGAGSEKKEEPKMGLGSKEQDKATKRPTPIPTKNKEEKKEEKKDDKKKGGEDLDLNLDLKENHDHSHGCTCEECCPDEHLKPKVKETHSMEEQPIEEGADMYMEYYLAEAKKKAKKEEEGKEKLVKENIQLRRLVVEQNQAIEKFKLLSAKQHLINKLFSEKNFSTDTKRSIVERFDAATTVKETKLIYDTINVSSRFGGAKSGSLNESVSYVGPNKFNNSVTPTYSSTNEEVEKARKVAGITRDDI